MYYYVGSAWFPAVWTSPLLPNSFLPFVCFLFISITLLCMEPFAVLTALLLWIQMFELLFLIRLHVECSSSGAVITVKPMLRSYFPLDLHDMTLWS